MLPESLLDVLIIGPAVEGARRWICGAQGIDLGRAARLLPELIWQPARAI
jgi:hypothetical protein